MLKIDYGRVDDMFYNVDVEFDLFFEMDWLKNETVKRILSEIDNCEWNGAALIDKTDRYLFPIHGISGGSKGLILCECLDECDKIWGTLFGDNCTDILLDICNRKDITIYLKHYLRFDPDKFQAFSVKKNRKYKDYDEYFNEISWEITKW